MDTSADVEKLQDVIRQLEVQNQKLRNRGANRSLNTTACQPSQVGDNNDLGKYRKTPLFIWGKNVISDEICDEPIVMEAELQFSSSSSNFISGLPGEDYEELDKNPWGAMFKYLHYAEKESSQKTTYADFEVAKRYVRNVAQRIQKKALKAQQPAFDEYATIEPLTIQESFTPVIQRKREVRAKSPETDNRSRSPIALPRPSQARLRDERERSISPTR